MENLRNKKTWSVDEITYLKKNMDTTKSSPNAEEAAKVAKFTGRSQTSVVAKFYDLTTDLRPKQHRTRESAESAGNAQETSNSNGKAPGMTVLVSCRCRKCGELNEFEGSFVL